MPWEDVWGDGPRQGAGLCHAEGSVRSCWALVGGGGGGHVECVSSKRGVPGGGFVLALKSHEMQSVHARVHAHVRMCDAVPLLCVCVQVSGQLQRNWWHQQLPIYNLTCHTDLTLTVVIFYQRAGVAF